MQEIKHTGRITAIERYVTQVEIIRSSACSECHAKELCGYSESEKKIVSVATDAFAMYSVGDEVELCMEQSMGMKAVWISYVVPLFVLLAALGLTTTLGCGELVSGLAAIAAVAAYYFVIFLFRGKLRNQFEFYIKKKNND